VTSQVFGDGHRGTSGVRVAVIAAGSLPPVQELVRSLPPHTGLALVVVCPVAGDVVAALRAASSFAVTEVRSQTTLQADRVFVVPRDCDASFQRSELKVAPASEPRGPFDKILRSLADEHGVQGTGVILSAQGSDGVLGIRRLKEAGGLTIVQAPESEAEQGPRTVIATGMIDLVLPLPAIAERMVALAGRVLDAAPTEDAAPRGPDAASDTLQDILRLVQLRSGHDFSSYKRATLYRRLSRRVLVCQCESMAAYERYLRTHSGELAHLLRDFLISVTNFFRDGDAFRTLALEAIPRMFAGKSSADQVRVWVAGCATGEEAYSIGMLLCEHASKLRDPPQLQIFATDIDEDALAQARVGRYPSTIAVDVLPERLQRFFSHDHDHYRINKELREIVLFSPHNLLRDPPFSRLDLVSCRNVLIYLDREAQVRVLNVFHFGLRLDGLLFLGSSESAENSTTFNGLDVKHRLFARRPSAIRIGSDAVVASPRWELPLPPSAPARAAERNAVGELHHQLVERYAPPSVLVDENLDVLHVSEHAGRLLQVGGGEPTRQLLRMIHPALRVDLRTAIHAARHSPSGSDSRTLRFDDAGTQRVVALRVRSIAQPGPGGGTTLVMLDELDSSPTHDASLPSTTAALEPMMRDLEAELGRTRDQLRTTIEQYETSVEELKASNEELQAMNEELRSATEELETGKEELQSVNEELTTLNHELKLKVDEVSHANSDLQNLMTSTDIGVVFLDRALNIKRFTPRAKDLINVIPSDVGRPLAHLTHRLEADDLPSLASSVLQTLRTVEREVRTREGRRYLARLLPYRSLEDRIDGVVLTFVEVSDLRDAIDARQRSEAALLASEHRLRLALRNAPMIIAGVDARLHTQWGYIRGEQFEARSAADAAAPGLVELLAPGEATRLGEIVRQVLTRGDAQHAQLDVVQGGQPRTYDFRIERNGLEASLVGFDITPSKLAAAALRDADRRKDDFLATLAHALRDPLTPLQVALDAMTVAADDPAKRRHIHEVMKRQVDHLGRLVDDVLDMSRLTQGKLELVRTEVDPARVVEQALEATRPAFEQRKHKLTVNLGSATARVLGDPARLTQVMVHLLANAARYTPPGGHIELSLTADRPRRVVAIRLADDGDGIEPEMLPKIFEMFVQGSHADARIHGGLGIGLTLVRRLVELHDGRVFASSAGLGRGSEFVVELPLFALAS